MTARATFTPGSMQDVDRIFTAMFGAQCFVCRRHPWPAGLTYKNLSVCAPCAALGRQAEIMSEMNDTTEAEDKAGMDGIDRAGSYLASIGKFDLRDLTDDELREFNAHWLAGFSESMRERVAEQAPF